jgi:hypothetical protein
MACPSLAMALLIASTGPLPVLAAGRTISPLSDPASPLGGVQSLQLLANQQETDEKEKKKKKKKGQQKLNQSERERTYQEGLDKGKDKGANKGYTRGYESGWNDRKAKDKDRWKDWDSNRWRDYNRNKRNIWTRRVVVNNNYYSSPSWARGPGWYNNRPWGGNWYGVSNSPPWGWWVGQSLVWGITALTTAAIINNAIDRAIARQQASIYVPNTNWQLYYGSVRPLAQAGVTFAVNNGYGSYQMEADCEQGLLNGEVPTSAAEAQLINAACQVTFGRGA